MPTWAIIAIVLAVAVGLYLWLRPSPAQALTLPESGSEDTSLQPNKDGSGFHFSFSV